jgi:hypothetical protein
LVHNIADITGDGSAHPLIASNVRTPACWLEINATAGNSAAVRIGDSTTSATSGTPVASGAGQLFPPIGTTQYMDLSQIWYYAANGDKFSVTYGVA